MAADRGKMQSQLEHLQLRHVGTGHADITQFEWMLNQHRDTLASHIAHPASLSYIAVVENETLARKKYDLVSKMVQPCGKPPKPKIPE